MTTPFDSSIKEILFVKIDVRYNLVGFDHKLWKSSKYAKPVDRETSKNKTIPQKSYEI